jgi:hypothetical protein
VADTVGNAASQVVGELESLGAAVVAGVQQELADLRDLAGRIASGLGLDQVLAGLEALYQSLKGKLGRVLAGEGPLADDDPKQVTIPLGAETREVGVTPCDVTSGVVSAKHPLSRKGDAEIEGAGSFGANNPSFTIDGTAEVAEGRDQVDVFVWLQLDNLWNVRSNGRTDITGPSDPKLTKDNWQQAADDLDPAKQDGDKYAGSVRRTSFWSSEITTQHELFHEKEILAAFPRIVGSKETQALADGRYVDVSSLWSFLRMVGFDMGKLDDNSKKVFAQIKKDIVARVQHELWQAVSDESAERRAYASGRQAYTELAAGIREHARQQGWH